MALFQDIDTLNPDMVAQNAAKIQEYATQLIANADFSKGTAIYDLLIRPAAIMQTIADLNVNRARLAGSLLKISEYPDLADTDMVNELLSNYRIYRQQGTVASGSVEVLISTNVITAIPSGSVFISGGLRFFTNQSFVGVPNEGLVSSTTDRLIKQIGTGVYSFLVDVTAENAGTAYQLSQGVSLVLQTPPGNYISSRAAYDFSTGVGAETNAELIARMPAGLANRTPGNRTNITALVQENYPGMRNISIIGYGEAEMTRDQDNLFLFSYGGKSDVYIQTALRPQVIRLTKTATLVNSNGTWQTFLDKDEFAGAYKVVAVLRTDQNSTVGSLQIVTEVRGVSAARDRSNPDMFVPHIDNYTQAAFSRYQSCTIEFLDASVDTSALTPMVSTGEYYVDLLVMPDIATIQDNIFSNPLIRAHRYDDIVRAPIPVLVSVSLSLRLRNGDSPNLPAMKQAIADRINQLSFSNSLSASFVVDVAHGLLNPASSVILPVDMLGELIDPSDGGSQMYRSATTLSIPDDYTKEISGKTVMFFCDPVNISIYVERA